MTEKYYVSDAEGGKEVPVPVRQDPFKDILATPEAQNKPEKAESQPQQPLTAGDAVTKEYKDSFAGKEEGVVEPPKEVVYGHCNNCRLELTEEKVTKQPIDYLKAEDGTMTRYASRFSVFCKGCMKFITVIDKDAQKMLQDMIRKGAK